MASARIAEPMAKKINLERHQSHCSICKHSARRQIEAEFLSWRSPAQIAREFKLGSRTAVWRHAKATNLFSQRKANVRNTFMTLIERGLSRQTSVPPSVVIQAAVALSKLDSEDRSVERIERINTDFGFLDDPRWTVAEMEVFAREGLWPEWHTREHPVTAGREVRSDKLLN